MKNNMFENNFRGFNNKSGKKTPVKTTVPELPAEILPNIRNSNSKVVGVLLILDHTSPFLNNFSVSQMSKIIVSQMIYIASEFVTTREMCPSLRVDDERSKPRLRFKIAVA